MTRKQADQGADEVTLRRVIGLAGQFGFEVTGGRYDGLTLVGSTYGNPGPVVAVLTSGVQVFVDEPERFGSAFNQGWVERFIEDEEVGR